MLSAREAQGLALLEPGKQGEELVDLVQRPHAFAAGMRPHQKVLVHGQAGEHPAAFGHVGDAQTHALVRRHLPDRPPVEAHLVVVGAEEAADGAQQGGLAGAVRADDGVLLALLDAQRDVEERLEAAVAGGDVVELEQAHTIRLPM